MKGTLAELVSSAAFAPHPTLEQHLVMLVSSSRPFGWIFGTLLYPVGMIHSGRIPNCFPDWAICLTQILTFGFPLGVVLFGVNDVHDYASDLVNPRKSATSLEGTVLPPAHHSFIYRAAISASVLIVGASTLPYFYAPPGTDVWQAWMPTISTATLVAFGWMYSAPPFRLKERPLIDSMANSFMCWLMWFTGFATCYTLKGMNCGLGDVPTVITSLALVAVGDHALAAAVDIKADTHAGHRTVATLLGIRGCAILGTISYAIALMAETFKSVFGIYFAGGLCVMLFVCMYPSPVWVHRAFQTIVYWTVAMSILWVITQAGGLAFPID